MSADRDRLEELAALVAAGADGEDCAELDRACDQDAEIAAMAAEYRDAAALLVDQLEPVDPPTRGFADLQAAIDRAADEDADAATSPAPRPSELHPETRRVVVRAQRRAGRATMLATFGFAAAAAFGFLWFRERDQASEMRAQIQSMSSGASRMHRDLVGELELERERREALERTLAQLEARYGPLRSPHLELATMRGAGGGTAKIFHDDDRGRWVVFAFELPAVSGRDYQLWFVPADGGAPVSAGLLERAADGTLVGAPAVPPELVGKCKPAISSEPAGGSKAPTPDQIKMIGSDLL